MALAGGSLYVGSALAVGLFEVFPPAVVAWFRISGAAVLLLALHRPSLEAFIDSRGFNAAVFGLATLSMNMLFYEAIARIPMGTAVAIEFLGPIAVAALGSRSLRDWSALILAGAGVLVISGTVLSDSLSGIAFALGAGAAWAAYIVVGSRIAGTAGASWDSLTAGFTWAAVLALPVMVFFWPADADMPTLNLLGLILGLGLLSAAVPYSLDQIVMRIAGAAYFAVLQAILPIVAAIVGAIALSQWLTMAELIGIVLVVAAVALRRP
ncbi:EamA family transporter [Corynebacterium yudongzhengii]|uniref:EamA family transporter n=2 Tax=Corynebacterium yudongzhengii TaxID=2080740 RepID=A0A2U1T6Q4_9CORY|nr:EamA family transporter [Corynebacterium yudongzhengii]PWC01568.1 EamA family transporter [Corynebacterium yudongzhengii]